MIENTNLQKQKKAKSVSRVKMDTFADPRARGHQNHMNKQKMGRTPKKNQPPRKRKADENFRKFTKTNWDHRSEQSYAFVVNTALRNQTKENCRLMSKQKISDLVE